MSIHNVTTLPKLCDCGEKAADMLRQQHAKIKRLEAALDGQNGDLLSDGAIYMEASRRAAPEAHAEIDKLIDAALTTTSGSPNWIRGSPLDVILDP